MHPSSIYNIYYILIYDIKCSKITIYNIWISLFFAEPQRHVQTDCKIKTRSCLILKQVAPLCVISSNRAQKCCGGRHYAAFYQLLT